MIDNKPEQTRPLSRRAFLRLASATGVSLAAGAVGSCGAILARTSWEAGELAQESSYYPCYEILDFNPRYVANRQRLVELEYDLLAATTDEEKKTVRAQIQETMVKQDTDIQNIAQCVRNSGVSNPIIWGEQGLFHLLH